MVLIALPNTPARDKLENPPGYSNFDPGTKFPHLQIEYMKIPRNHESWPAWNQLKHVSIEMPTVQFNTGENFHQACLLGYPGSLRGSFPPELEKYPLLELPTKGLDVPRRRALDI